MGDAITETLVDLEPSFYFFVETFQFADLLIYRLFDAVDIREMSSMIVVSFAHSRNSKKETGIP